MRPNEPVKIVVGANDSIPDVLTRLRTATGGSATIAIPAASSLFLTASEFRALKATTDQSRITLTVETDDRLRKQLANMFRIPVVDLLPGAVVDLKEAAAEPEVDEPPEIESVLPELPKLDLPPAVEVAPNWKRREPGDPDADGDEAVDEPPRRSLQVPAIPWKVVGIAAGAVLLLAVIGVAAAYFLRSATVEITVKRQPVTAEITYAVVSPGVEAPSGGAFTITAAPVDVELPFRQTIPTTGELREPDQIASGRIALRNPTDAPVEIPEGTAFTDRNGIDYTFGGAVTVPPADESGAGRAEADIRAAAGGEAANRDMGLLSGQLDNGIYYSNRDAAITGGTDRVTRVVSQADIDQLIANANQQLQDRLIGAPLDDGRIVLPGTLQPGELNPTFDHQPGEQAETVSIDATMTANAMAFNPADAVAQATEQLEADLEANTPQGYELEHSTLTPAPPVLVNDQGDAGLYVLTVAADARAIVDDAQRDQLADVLTGLDPDEAEEVTRGYPFVEAATVGVSPGIIFTSLPDSAGRIEIETR